MKKPFYQLMLENAIPFLFLLTTAATAIDAITHAVGFWNYKIGFVLFVATCISYLIFTRKIAAGKVKWVTKEGHTVRLKKLSIKSEIFSLGIIYLLAAYTAYDFTKNRLLFKQQTTAEAPVFERGDRHFNVLILPWQQECDYKGMLYDIGFVLKQRLENISIQDSIRLRVVYLDDMVMSKNFSPDSAFALMRYHNASQILYGNQSLGECEGDGSDKICYRYITDPEKFDPHHEHARNDEYKMIDFHGHNDIRTGAGQEHSDYVLYWVAAMSEMKNNDYVRAIRMFEKIPNYQKEEEVLFQISDCYYRMKNYAAARAHIEKVLAVNPQHEEADLHIIMLLMEEGKREAAKIKFEKFVPTNLDDEKLLIDLCIIYKELKDTIGYNKYFALLQEVVPETDNRLWGEIYQKLGEPAKARYHYEKALAVCAKHPRDWYVLGELNLRLKDTLKAKPYFIHALKIDPNCVTALFKMGVLFHKEGDYKKAEEYLEKAVKVIDYDKEALIALGNNYDKLGKQKLALTCFEKAIVIQPNDAFALIGAAVQLMKLKNYGKANKYLDQLVDRFSNDIQVLDKIAYLCAEKENYAQAKVYYKRLLNIAPGNGAVLYNLASMSACEDFHEDALQYLSQALIAMPSLKTMANKDKAFDELRTTPKFIAMTQ